MAGGATVIITQVDVTGLSSNQLYMDVLRSRSQLYHAKATTKIMVGTHLMHVDVTCIFVVCSLAYQDDLIADWW